MRGGAEGLNNGSDVMRLRQDLQARLSRGGIDECSLA